MQQIISVLQGVCEGKNAIAYLCNDERNELLEVIACALEEGAGQVLEANAIDLEEGKKEGKPSSFLDRLMLDNSRISSMCEGLRQLKDIDSPVGDILENFDTQSKLSIKKVCVPLGVFAIIYEARPNVTADTIGLAVKSGNGIVLRGSKDAINSNKAMVKVIKEGIDNSKFDSSFIGLVEDITHEGVNFLLKQRDYIDVVIPRGGENLIKNTISNSLIPCIETGLGNCHVYVSQYCDFEKAKELALSAKVSRVSVCNSAESLVINRALGGEKISELLQTFIDNGVELRGSSEVISFNSNVILANDNDYYKEYNAMIMSVTLVDTLDECISHINKHSTHHSEAIISCNQEEVDKFTQRIDSACVFHNTSTRFSDGFQFGFGAEVGISTQKLHARGPMGIKELTTYKYAVSSDYQIR